MTIPLFTSIRLAGLEIPNRIVVSPMCQYSAVNGNATDWHLVHLGQFALSGAGLVFVEATAVEARGRISAFDLGLYSNENEEALKPILAFFKKHGASKLGIQLAHAGRKAASKVPWQGSGSAAASGETWQAVAPSAIAYNERYAVPQALSQEQMLIIKKAFVDSARCALRLGFDLIELHMAHGYLLHEFLSPLSNQRDDKYGGSLENRMRFPLEIFQAVKNEMPSGYPLGVRISATDYVQGGWDIESSISFCKLLEIAGCAFVDVSSGGASPEQKLQVGWSYQLPLATQIKQNVTVPIIAVGVIVSPKQANDIISEGKADMTALGRMMLYKPRFPWHAAEQFGVEISKPVQYGYATGEAWKKIRES